MPATIDGNAVFGTGPVEVVAGGLERDCVQTPFNGGAGVYLLGLGGDRRTIKVTGDLKGAATGGAGAAAALKALMDGLDALVQADNHTLIDAFGLTWTGVCLVEWSPTGPRSGTDATEVVQPFDSTWLQNDFASES